MVTSDASATFGGLLRRYRLEAGLTQEALAERAGLSARGVQSLEGGVSQPYRNTVQQLTAALRLTAEQHAEFEAAAAPTPRRRQAAPLPRRFDEKHAEFLEYERMLTVRGVAERLRVHVGTVRHWLEERQLHGIKLGGRAGWRIRESELQRFLKEREPTD
jgi:excisionase family DNA binding protein